MCGIYAIAGMKGAAGKVFAGLQMLDYRGYDSWGIAYPSGKYGGGFSILKNVGKIENFSVPRISSSLALGHTRWATNGEVSMENTHPMISCDGKIAVVHNGIIENHIELRRDLTHHNFSSTTDSEVIAHLLEEETASEFMNGAFSVFRKIKGTFAVVAAKDGEMIAARKGSPLIVGECDDGAVCFASDVHSLPVSTKGAYFLDDHEGAIVSDGGLKFFNFLSGEYLTKVSEEIDITPNKRDKKGYEHYMRKEIHEQPKAALRFLESKIELPELLSSIKNCCGITILACGTSYHAGLIGKRILEGSLSKRVIVESASEFRSVIPSDELVITLSQSGETLDTLMALRRAKKSGCKSLAIVNVEVSSIARESDFVLPIKAGAEIGVASTKSFTNQVLALFKIAEMVSGKDYDLIGLVSLMENSMSLENRVVEISKKLAGKSNALFLGRGILCPIAMEGALKLKEISYIHAEGISAGEMKHGPIALIDNDMPVVFVLSTNCDMEKSLSNLSEVKARGGKVIAVTDKSVGIEDEVIVPTFSNNAGILIHGIILQMLAYHTAKFRHCDIDKPRNLAKSVTVE